MEAANPVLTSGDKNALLLFTTEGNDCLAKRVEDRKSNSGAPKQLRLSTDYQESP